MDEIGIKKYMNPITFEAEMFVNSLETLSKTYNNIDAVLMSSLEKVMNAIEKFLDANENEVILATETTKLVACDDIKHVKRIFHCSLCKTDLGKSVEKATLHLIDTCTPHGSGAAPISLPTSETTLAANAKTERKNQDKSILEKREDRKKNLREKRIRQAVKLTKKTRSLLTTDFDQFFADHVKIGNKLKCLPDYEIIENDLISIITPLFPNESVKIYKFGSRLAGIGTRESDLDLFIDIGGVFNNFHNRGDAETLDKLHKVGKALSNSHKWKSLVMIDRARVPILRILHTTSTIECDINLSNSLGIINTQFLELIFTLQPIARLMCIFMKKWLNRTNLNYELSTYSIILMVIFYLQSEKVLPPVERFQQGVNKSKALRVGPWLCAYETLSLNELNIPSEELTQKNLLKFIRGFFQFYISFKYDINVICPYLGESVKRSEFNSHMPERYLNYIKDSADYALEMDNSIVVQDFIQLNHNVTKALSPFHLQLFTTYMIKSLEIIKDNFVF